MFSKRVASDERLQKSIDHSGPEDIKSESHIDPVKERKVLRV